MKRYINLDQTEFAFKFKLRSILDRSITDDRYYSMPIESHVAEQVCDLIVSSKISQLVLLVTMLPAGHEWATEGKSVRERGKTLLWSVIIDSAAWHALSTRRQKIDFYVGCCAREVAKIPEKHLSKSDCDILLGALEKTRRWLKATPIREFNFPPLVKIEEWERNF